MNYQLCAAAVLGASLSAMLSQFVYNDLTTRLHNFNQYYEIEFIKRKEKNIFVLCSFMFLFLFLLFTGAIYGVVILFN